MATDTDEIMKKARELGKMVADHPHAKKFAELAHDLGQDVEAQRVLTDYDRHLQALSEKEQAGKPIEVEDKRKLEQLQQAVVKNKKLRDFQMAQMDYLDLMRRIDEAISGESAPDEVPAAAQRPMGNPDLSGQG